MRRESITNAFSKFNTHHFISHLPVAFVVVSLVTNEIDTNDTFHSLLEAFALCFVSVLASKTNSIVAKTVIYVPQTYVPTLT